MEKPKLYMTRLIPERGLKKIRERFEVEIWPEEAPPPKEVIVEKVRGKDALVSLLTDKIDAEVMDASPNLRIIAQYAVGFDNIDLKAATERGIYVTNTPGVLTETVADFAFALMLAAARRVVEADRYVREGKWKVGWHPTMMLGYDVYERTLGIVGLGRIGSAVARRAKGFNMKVIYYDVRRRPELERELGVEYRPLEELLKDSDFVSLHVPLTPETRHMIGERELRMMKKTAVLVNTARGPVVDEKALYRALKEGWIAAAALDVFEKEPTPVDNPLLELSNVVVAPHIASASFETRSRMAEMVAENLIAFLEGRTPPNLVNKEVVEVRKPGFS
ncbi:MAG: D-glycerate dehydrogenase [Thermoproteota archaeon]|nr:MAG: D-glycerate dehydrogenase [Candidatus Korarchaeota archaeon]RLG54620.1 MAG: D-glycerate dehydrogenase [Candidatus Korarchaeota archaeon]